MKHVIPAKLAPRPLQSSKPGDDCTADGIEQRGPGQGRTRVKVTASRRRGSRLKWRNTEDRSATWLVRAQATEESCRGQKCAGPEVRVWERLYFQGEEGNLEGEALGHLGGSVG